MLSFELTQICHHRLLTKKEEYSLGVAALAGCKDSAKQLVDHNLRLVATIAKNFRSIHHSWGDCINVGTLGLMDAAKTYDPAKHKTRFSTYATWCIRNRLIREYRKQKTFNTRNHVDSDITECALNVEAESMEEEMALDKAEKLTRLNAALDKLTPEDRYLLKARFGLPPNTRIILLRELAEVEGLTKERIRQKEVRAMERLRALYGES